MNHEPQVLKFDEVYNAIDRHTDLHWTAVMGIDDDAFDAAEGADDESAYQEAETALLDRMKGTWWYVTWPAHVTTPRFNGDASYDGPYLTRPFEQ